MLVRVIVLLLVVLNLGAAAWIASTYRDAPPPAEAADATPRLLLLSERDATNEVVAPAPTATRREDETCVSIGPFSNQADLRVAMNALTPLTRRIQFREGTLAQSRGWWVYLPTFPTRELALEAARDLSSRGVGDYYVISAGDQQNTISLGLFRERANAEHRQAELTALNLNPLLGERNEEMPVYWIDYADVRDAPVDWRARLAGTAGLVENRIDCF